MFRISRKFKNKFRSNQLLFRFYNVFFHWKLSFFTCYIHLPISKVHAHLVMRDGAWPAGHNVDEVILLYKTSGSNLARDFYVLPIFSSFSRISKIPITGLLAQNSYRTVTRSRLQHDWLCKLKFKYQEILMWGASFRRSFGPNSAWGTIETTTLGKTHPTLVVPIRTLDRFYFK